MSEELIKSLIIWAPTILFVLSLLFYFLVGIIRGLRKSVILLIHATVSLGICATIFFLIVRSENMDETMVSIVNYVLQYLGTSIQKILGVSEELGSAKDIILDFVLSNMTGEELYYYVIVDAGAYISTLVELIYRMALFIILGILHLFLMGFLNFIYMIFYPVRRKVRKVNKAFERGEVAQPYQRRRLAGGFVGMGRGLVVNIFMLSFLGCLLFIVTGRNNPLPDRGEGTDEEISFGDETINTIYDYYSVVCEMSDSGVFAVLNAIKDSDDKPYYFYICDLMLQGGIEDENLGISDTFYLREEIGTYLGFCKDAISLFIEYAGSDVNVLLSGDQDAMLEVMTKIMKNEEFVNDFSKLIDDFETQPFFINLILSALTSAVNHIELVVGEDSPVTRLVRKVFDKETGIKVTDLATEQDIKHLFKSVINIASTALADMEEANKVNRVFINAADEQAFDIKLAIKYANLLIDDIQALSLFTDRSDIGNNLLKNVYEFCVDEFVAGQMDLPEVAATKWIDELNILFDAIEPILNIAVEIYSDDSDAMINNLLTMFNSENENAAKLEAEYDKLVNQLSKSNLLDLVFKVTLPGETIDGLLQNMTGNPDATMPHTFSLASKNGESGELEILLNVLKDFLKNDGVEIFELLGEDLSEESLTRVFELLSVDINPSEEVEEKLIDSILSSKIFRYVISSFVTYSNLCGFELYIPVSSSELITETVFVTDEEGNKVEQTKVHNIIKKEELSVLTDFVLNSPDFIFDLMNQSEEIDYVELLTSDEIVDLLNDSTLLQGIIASVIISVSKDMEMIVLPYSYDNPDTWIKNKEVKAIIDAILTLKNEETESGESLFNELMSGNVDINTILDLSQETIDSVYKSNVLKYTVSDLLTNLGSEGFAIVVPGVSCEKPNAITTTEKRVNVISSKEILAIFDQIKNIIEFDDNNNVTILYSKMFNNKSEILSSYTIQATVMNMLINMTGDDDSIISVPRDYKDAYNSFLTISSESGLKNNKWFGETREQDELYLLFEGIESLVSDEYKDENGNILDTFSLDKIATDIEIDHSTIDTVSTSAILNSTLSNVITSNFATPISVYHNDKIDRTELEALFDCLFKLLDKDVLTFDDFSSIDINSIEITKNDINNIYKKSEIFMTALSNMIMEVENICLPKVATAEVEIMPMNDKDSVFRIIDASLVEEGKINEFDNLIDCLFEFFGSTNGEGVEVLNVSTINVDDLKLNEEKIDKISSSTIFTATISTIISTTEVIIPVETAIYAEMADGKRDYILENEELNNLLKTFLEMFGSVNTVTEKKELDVNNIDLSNFIIDQEVKDKIVETAVLRATISNYLITNDLGVVIPKIKGTIDEIQVVGSDTLHNSITKDELGSFLDAAIELFGIEEDGEKVLNINKIDTSDFIINDENALILGGSNIINATITQELASIDELAIPVKDEDGNSIATLTSNAKDNTSCAIIDDITGFMDNMLDVLGGTEREINPSNLSTINIKLVKGDDIDGILWATISKELLNTDDILIPDNNETIEYVDLLTSINGGISTSSKELITNKQLNEFKDALVEVLGEEEVIDGVNKKTFELSLDSGVDVNGMVITSKHADSTNDDYLFDSTIFTATVAEAIMGVEELTVPFVIKEKMKFYNRVGQNTIMEDQVVALFNSLFLTMGSDEININNFNMDNINLPSTRDNVEKMFKSWILAATVSKTITSSASNSIVILDQALGLYEYDDNDPGNEKYITKEELENLILALTVGLGKTNAGDLDIGNVTIPETDEKMNALLGSKLIRATISKEIINQTGETTLVVEGTDCDDDKEEYTINSTTRVMVIDEKELKLLIKGLKALQLTDTSSFDNIDLDIKAIIQDGSSSVNAVANSSILRSVISDTLLTRDQTFGLEYYMLIGSSSQINSETGYHYLEYSKPSEAPSGLPTALHLLYYGIFDYFHLQMPTPTQVYRTFELSESDLNSQNKEELFTKEDIKALQGMQVIIQF